MKSLFSLFFCLFFFSFASAQTPVAGGGGGGALDDGPVGITPPPAFLPIGSYGQLKAYALEHTEYAQMDINAISYTSIGDYANVISGNRRDGESPIAFVQRILKSQFKFGLLDKRDQITANASVWTNNGQGSPASLLFYGQASTWAFQLGDGSWGFEFGTLKLHLADYIQIPAGGITNAWIHFRDENGQFQWPVSVYVYDGYLYFPTKYAGRQGQLVGWVSSMGKQVAYDLSNDGHQITPIPVAGAVAGMLDNVFEVQLQQGIGVQSVFISATANTKDTPPVVRITVPNDGIYIVKVLCRIARYNRVIGVPNQAFLKREGAPTEDTGEVAVTPEGEVTLRLGGGSYYLTFENDSIYSAIQPQLSPADNIDDGKGG